MNQNHEGKRLRQYIRVNDRNVDELLEGPLKGQMSKGTFYKLYDRETFLPKHRTILLSAGIDYLGQPVQASITPGVMSQEEGGLTEKVRQLEEQVAQLNRSVLDLYSRLPKPSAQ